MKKKTWPRKIETTTGRTCLCWGTMFVLGDNAAKKRAARRQPLNVANSAC